MGGVVSQLVVAPFLVAPLERVKVLLQVRLSKYDLRARSRGEHMHSFFLPGQPRPIQWADGLLGTHRED